MSSPAHQDIDEDAPQFREFIEGQGFEPGAQVELTGSKVAVLASGVLAVGSTALSATVRAPDSPGGLLDLLVRLPDGRTAQLPAAIAVSAPMATAQASPSLSKPTNDAAAFRTFDLYADRVAVLQRGRLTFVGPTAEYRDLHAEEIFT